MDSGEWESKYDKAVSSLVRETLTISEVFFFDPYTSTLNS